MLLIPLTKEVWDLEFSYQWSWTFGMRGPTSFSVDVTMSWDKIWQSSTGGQCEVARKTSSIIQLRWWIVTVSTSHVHIDDTTWTIFVCSFACKCQRWVPFQWLHQLKLLLLLVETSLMSSRPPSPYQIYQKFENKGLENCKNHFVHDVVAISAR